jgi:DNA-binding SARP family transcriptional activator
MSTDKRCLNAWGGIVPRFQFTVRILGGFEVSGLGRAPIRMWPKPRTLLAQLLVADGPVPMRRVLGELWPGGAPESAAANVRGYVHIIRRQLGQDTVQTLHGGVYRLSLPGVRMDSRIFLGLLGRSHTTADPRERTALLGQALALWEGPALSGVPQGPMLRNWVTSMQGHRRRALLDLAELLVRGGQCGDAQYLLRQHLLEWPEDEAAYVLLMRALYAAGDGGGALTVYRQAYDELAGAGLRPGPRLAAAQNAVLHHRPLPAGF